jgi:protein-disulfide isomerase
MVIVLLGLAAGAPAPVGAEGLTEQQGQAILNELRQIRQLLQRMERRGASVASQHRPQAAPVKAKVSSKGRPLLGDPDAPLTLVEFTDYQCPFCNRFFKTTFPALKKAYIDTGKVRFVVKDLPLPIHKNARKAAQAAHCAGDQGRFWAMHDTLYENAAELEETALLGYAEALSLDLPAFRGCLASDRHFAAIDGDAAEAAAAGIRGTPGFVLGLTTDDFIDGVHIRGAQPFAAFDKQIKALLQKVTSAKRG